MSNLNLVRSGRSSLVVLMAVLLAVVRAENAFQDLWNAALVGTPEEIRAIIASGVDVNERADEGRLTLLMLSVWGNPHFESVEAFLAAGADVNAVDGHGMTALMYAAAFNDNPDRIQLLLRFGADPALRNADGLIALDYLLANEALVGTVAEEWLAQDVPSPPTAVNQVPSAQAIELEDGTRLTGSVEAADLIFTTQYGAFSIDAEEIVRFSADGLELTDGTRLVGAFTQGIFRASTSRAEFEVSAQDVIGLDLSAHASPSGQAPVPTDGAIPGEADARLIFQERLDGVFGSGLAQIDHFEKVDGQSSVVNGVDQYKLDFSATVSYPQGVHPDCNPDRPFSWDCWNILTSREGIASKLGLKSKGWRDVGETEGTSGSARSRGASEVGAQSSRGHP